MDRLSWLKSSFSEASGNNCVELATADSPGDRGERTGIAIRESSAPEQIITAHPAALRLLLDTLKAEQRS